MIRYGSLCSGIEAAGMAWHPLGWQAAFFSEIEAFPNAVLAHHHPTVPNFGDMTRFKDWPDVAIDLLVGGTPCQSFSVAGLRAGLADPRGNLMLTYLAVAAKYRPRWLVWENVPGVLSSGDGRDFGALLGGLGQLGYGFAYRVLDAQYIRVGGFERAVPQRRRRVFVVGYLGDWRRAAAVLFDAASLRGDPAPRREAGQRVAGTIGSSLRGGGGIDPDFDGGLIAAGVAGTLNSAGGHAYPGQTVQDAVSNLLIPSTGAVAHCLNAGAMGRIDYETETMIAHALRADGFDASEDGTGRGTPIVPVFPIDMRQASRGDKFTNNRAEGSSGGAPGTGVGRDGDPAPTIAHSHIPAVAFTQNSRSEVRFLDGDGGIVGALAADAGAQQQNYIAFQSSQSGVRVDDVHATLDSNNGSRRHNGVIQNWAVRRLTPTECERLQGFPDGFTAVPYRGKPAADGPRYKALGNSMAVNAMRFIGERIAMVDAIAD